jgi:hypothetical protein
MNAELIKISGDGFKPGFLKFKKADFRASIQVATAGSYNWLGDQTPSAFKSP